MKKINWSIIVIIGVIALLLLFSTAMFGGWGMMGPGMMGRWGYYFPFMWIGMMFMWLIPIGFLILIALGIVWLVRNLGVPMPPASRACPNCGKSVQADWQNCPYCGTSLK